jgi:hypothetical protein
MNNEYRWAAPIRTEKLTEEWFQPQLLNRGKDIGQISLAVEGSGVLLRNRGTIQR